MRSSIPTWLFSGAVGSALKVAIPFKWGQVFQHKLGVAWRLAEIIKVAIPFKWGQVFQLNEGGANARSTERVAIPFKWGQVFQLRHELYVKCYTIKVAIPFKWGQVSYKGKNFTRMYFKNPVAIPFKWGQVSYFSLWRKRDKWNRRSQSLLNEVKFPTLLFPLSQRRINGCRNPF